MSSDNTPMSAPETRTCHALPLTPELVQKAQIHIGQLSSDKDNWRMTIPVSRDDSDMFLTALCESHEMLRAQVAALQNPLLDKALVEAAHTRGYKDACLEHVDGYDAEPLNIDAIVKEVDANAN